MAYTSPGEVTKPKRTASELVLHPSASVDICSPPMRSSLERNKRLAAQSVIAKDSASSQEGLRKLGNGGCPGEKVSTSTPGEQVALASMAMMSTSQTDPISALNAAASSSSPTSAALDVIRRPKSTTLSMKPRKKENNKVSPSDQLTIHLLVHLKSKRRP